MPAPPVSALLAILDGQTQITRRCEIYMSDGETIFAANPLMTDGSVTVDYTRNDRRNIDVTLNNSDGSMVHKPSGIWYDKIVKVYRGVRYVNTKTQPVIAILDSTTAPDILRFFAELGYKDVRIITSPTFSNVSFADIIVASYNGTSDISTPHASLIASLYASGKNVMTISPFATAATVPLIASMASPPTELTGNSKFLIQNSTSGTPFSDVDDYQINVSTPPTYSLPLASRTTAFVGATASFTNSGNTTTGLAVIYEINSNLGSKWVHYHAPILDVQPGGTDNITYANWHYDRDIFIKSIVDWIYSYSKELDWEVQVGEFMIDQIYAPRFPKTIKLTGRDYWKKLANNAFDNAISFNAGLVVDTLIQDIAANAGITKFRLGSLGAVTAAINSFSGESFRADAILAICNAANVEVFFDNEGYLTTRPFFDPSTSAPTLTLNTGNGGNLVDWAETSDDSVMYNRICVSGTDANSTITGNIYQGIAENHQVGSPTSYENLGYFRTYYYSSSFFTSNDQCLAYAQSLLAFHSLESFSIDYSSLVFAWLEAGEIIEIDRPNQDSTEPNRFLNVNFTIPLTLIAMTGTSKRITIVG